MKCLITDEVYEGIAEELKGIMDVTETNGKTLSHDELLEQIGEYDILIMRVVPQIDKEILDAAKNLKMIGVCAVGTNHIDMEYAKEKGIAVYNAVGLNANAVAELTLAMMLNMSRETVTAVNDVKQNHNWNKRAFMGRELKGKSLGVLDFGRIGGYATDVLENEEERPGIIDDGSLHSPLFECENFLATPHMGAQTRDASISIGIFMIEKVKEFVAQL